MALSAEHYARQLAALLPPGIAFESEPGSDMAELLHRVGSYLAAADSRANQLRDEANPYRTLALLPEWEASLGLPDSCSVGAPTLAERRAAIIARLTDAGGARIPRFVQIAKAMGYDGVSTSRFKPHTCEMSCESPIYSDDWRFAWQLNVPQQTVAIESTCESGVEDPLRVWGSTELECVISRECPQPSIVLISYGAS